MKDDLLILRLLKVPVTAIKYLSKGVAMLTYLPNYLIILALDTVIFSQMLSSTLLYYAVSWPLRLISLVGVVAIFCAQFYFLYSLLSISHFHWGVQLLLTFIAFQGVLALMRHGYLTMINKFSPTKLKSPLEHLVEVRNMIVDILGMLLALVNAILIINIFNTLNYEYSPSKPFKFIKHIAKLIHTSVLDIIKLFYIKIFFRLFPWRYQHSITEVQSEKDNILQLTVLLTLLFFLTLLDLVSIMIFGVYCYFVHPRKALYRNSLRTTHQKYKATGKFVLNSTIEILQCLVLLFCLPFKYAYSRQVLSLVLAKQNDYSFHYWLETLFVLKLALVKIPSLFCELLLIISIYKHKKIAYILKQRQLKLPAGADSEMQKPMFQVKMGNAASASTQEANEKLKKSKAYEKQMRHQQKQYIVFRCFASLLSQVPFMGFVPLCTLLKPWNVKWLKYLIDDKYDIRCSFVIDYFFKILKDYLCFFPTILSIIMLGFYDPVKQKIILKSAIQNRKLIKSKLPLQNCKDISEKLQFYNGNSAILPKILQSNFDQIKKDIFFLPLFVATRLTLLSSMGCTHPADAVQLFEYLWMLFYMRRVKKTAYFNQYIQFLRADEAAGMINNHRERLRFWKFAHKSCRHRLLRNIFSHFLPKKRADKAIVNAPIEKNFSAIANHYWHQYNITMSLIQYLIYFAIEMIITFIGVVFLLPLTLWRMPTFLILFKTHKYKKNYFFNILFKMYKQMAKDLISIFVKIPTIIIFPRASLAFFIKTTFRYTNQGVNQFQRIQKAKMWYIFEKILQDGLSLYGFLWKILFVKVFWVRKRDMNNDLKQNKVKLSVYVKDFLMTSQITPGINQLKALYGGFKDQASQQNLDEKQKQNKQKQNSAKENELQKPSKNELKLGDINSRGLLINSIVQPYLNQTKQDIPFLFLMIFLLITLPWRLFYIKNALFLMRDDNIHRQQFFRLLRMIAKDYQSIMLYIVLLFSIVKTKRAIILFIRNVKLNFYVGTLKYSHLKQLRQQVKEAGHFYYSFAIILASCIFGPYRILQILRNLKLVYKKYKEQKQVNQNNQKMYDNTVKQGKSLQLLTGIGHNSLLHVFRFLDARQLTKMTRVSKYMYDTIKQRDQVWMDMWERVYQPKYPGYAIKNDVGNLSYNSMCIEKYKNQNQGLINDDRDRLFKLALHQFNQSTFETILDLKSLSEKLLPVDTHRKLFTSLAWDLANGYGPEQNWPRPDDNQEYLLLFNIERRPVVELAEDQAWVSWLFERPIQFMMVRMRRLYNTNTHRRKKQILYALFNLCTPISVLMLLIRSWGWIWTFDMLFGYKFVAVSYSGIFIYLFVQRYKHEARDWIVLHPYDIINDIRIVAVKTGNWIKNNSVKAGNFAKERIDKYVWRPIKWVSKKINYAFRWLGRKIKYVAELFIQKVAKPLYISISHKIIALWTIIKALYRTFTNTIVKIAKSVKKLIQNIYNVLFQIVKSISKTYANSLQFALRLSLSYGTVGQLIFTILIILCMVSPSIFCYYFYTERWFIIFSTLMTMVLMVTGYKHLNRMKERVLTEIKA